MQCVTRSKVQLDFKHLLKRFCTLSYREKVAGIPGWQSVAHTPARKGSAEMDSVLLLALEPTTRSWCLFWPRVVNPSRSCVCFLDNPAFLRTCCSLTRWQSRLPPLFILTRFVMHRASLQISLRLQKGREKITCKHKDMHANTLFMCYSHAACACRHLRMLICTHIRIFGCLYPTG